VKTACPVCLSCFAGADGCRGNGIIRTALVLTGMCWGSVKSKNNCVAAILMSRNMAVLNAVLVLIMRFIYGQSFETIIMFVHIPNDASFGKIKRGDYYFSDDRSNPFSSKNLVAF